MASTEEIEHLYKMVAKVKVTENVETNNSRNKTGYIYNISSTGRARINFDSGQNMRNSQWWIPFKFIQPVTVSFLDIK